MGKDEVELERLCTNTIKLKGWGAVVSCKTAVTLKVLIEIKSIFHQNVLKYLLFLNF